MFKKLTICLSRPRQIAMYLFEKTSRTVLTLILFCFIAILPNTILLFNSQNIDNNDEKYLEEVFMNNNLDFNLAIKDGILAGDEGISIALSNFVLFVNPTNEPLDYGDSFYLKALPTIEFQINQIYIHLGNIKLKTLSYQELGVRNLDFGKIMRNHNYHEFDLLINVLNQSYKEISLTVCIIKTIALFIETVLMVFLMALLLGFISKIFNPLLIFKVRFKVALNCQYIFLLTILFASLFSAEWLIYIGSFLSCYYLFFALRQIVKVELHQK